MTLFRIFLLFILFFTLSSSLEESGPYKLYTLYLIDRCNRTTKPYETVPSATSHFWAHNTTDNTSLVDANITVFRDLKNLSGIIKLYHVENGKWYLESIVEKVDCKSFLTTMLAKIWGFKPWKEYCTIPKGTYLLNNIDLNKAYHLWKQEMHYGVIVRRIEAVKGSKTVFCFEIVLNVVPEISDSRLVATPEPSKGKKT